MSTVFTRERSVLDQALLAGNLALAGVALGVVGLVFAGGAPEWLRVPLALSLVVWLFATPLLAGFGGYRARVSGRRNALLLHSVLGSAWAVGMTVAVVMRSLHV